MDKLKEMLLTNTFAKIMEIVAVFLTAFIIIKIFAKPDSNALIYNQAVVWIANIMMLILVWMGLKIRGEGWQDFGLSFNKTGIKAALKVFGLSLLVFIFAMVGFIIGSIIMANITGIPQQANMSAYAFLEDNLPMLFISLIGVYIVSSFGEEVIYRAFLINRFTQLGLNSKSGKIVAVILSAVIFGFAHYSWGPMGIVQTGFMGLALGLCYIFMKKRLWVLILAHVYMDTILLVQMYLASN